MATADVKEDVKQKYGDAARAVSRGVIFRPAAIRDFAVATRLRQISIAPRKKVSFLRRRRWPRWDAGIPPR
jgi:hypothetical protein